MDWPETGSVVRVWGVENKGRAHVQLDEAQEREIQFRTDRVDWTPDGPRLIDYKTGKPAITVVTEAKRDSKLLALLTSGSLLQGLAYAMSADGATGEYRYLRPDLDPRVQHILVDRDDTETRKAGIASLKRTFEAMEGGLLFPRLIEANFKTGASCEYCDVKTACRHGDSEWRGRMMERADQLEEKETVGSLSREERLWLDLFRRGNTRKEER